MQRADLLADLGIRLGDALVLSDIFDPGRAVVALDPERRVGQVAQQGPVPGAVAAPDAPALRHHGQEGDDVLGLDDVFDGDDDRARARLDIDRDLRLAPAAERVEIELFQRRQAVAQSERGADQ